MPATKKKASRSNTRAPRARRTSLAAALPAGVSARAGARTEYRIYPSIGIARVGDSTDGFFIGPEAPGIAPAGPFRGGGRDQAAGDPVPDLQGRNRQQRKRNRDRGDRPGGKVAVDWTVSLENRKAAASRLWIRWGGSPNPGLRNRGLRSQKAGDCRGRLGQGRRHGRSGAVRLDRVRKAGQERTGRQRYQARQAADRQKRPATGRRWPRQIGVVPSSPRATPSPTMTVGTTASRTVR